MEDIPIAWEQLNWDKWYLCHVLEDGQWLKNTGQGESNQPLLNCSQTCGISKCSGFHQEVNFYVNFKKYFVKSLKSVWKKGDKNRGIFYNHFGEFNSANFGQI